MSQTRYLKSMITPTLVEPTENHEAGVASGVWSTQDQLEARRGSVWPEAGVTNPDTLIEGNFSIDLYEGNGSTQSITTGLDLTSSDGLVWIKNRDATDSHVLTDTVRGATKILHSDSTAAEATDTDTITSFTSTGFVLGDDVKVNTSAESYAAWTFKKAPKFFDVVTYTGTGSAHTIAHSLGLAPGFIMIKNRGTTDNWAAYHKGVAGGSNPENYYVIPNTAAQQADDAAWWNDTAPTSSVFTVGTDHSVNADGETYVAYLWADNSSLDAADQMLSTGFIDAAAASGPHLINLGWEPQYVWIKRTTVNIGNWLYADTMRGLIVDSTSTGNITNNWDTAAADDGVADAFGLRQNGFVIDSGQVTYSSASNYIYMAIRRPNMATITDATEVFGMDLRDDTDAPMYKSGFVTDFSFYRSKTGTDDYYVQSRLTGVGHLHSNTTVAENVNFTDTAWDYMNGFYNAGSANSAYQAYMWKRAKGFFDVVAYTGNDTVRTIAHGLGVVPEMIWVKTRSTSNAWWVYYGDNTDYLVLNTTAATVDSNYPWQDTSPTSSVFTVGDIANVNENGATIIAYLFATLAGVSKIGTVTHSGSSTDVDCGFTAGARFVLLKRVDATGDWFVWDSVRGIIAGNDPYLLLNDDAAQVTNTDLIDPLASGFQISGDFTDGDYIFYAIA